MREPFSRNDKHKQEKTHIEHKVYTQRSRSIDFIRTKPTAHATETNATTRRSSGDWTAPGSRETVAAAAGDAVV